MLVEVARARLGGATNSVADLGAAWGVWELCMAK